jgi:hypothetical protein
MQHNILFFSFQEALREFDSNKVSHILEQNVFNIDLVSDNAGNDFNPLIFTLHTICPPSDGEVYEDDYLIEEKFEKAIDVFKVLLHRGANVNFVYKKQTPFKEMNKLLFIVSAAALQTFQLFLENGANPKVWIHKMSPLHNFLDFSSDYLFFTDYFYISTEFQNVKELSWKIIKSMVLRGFSIKCLHFREYQENSELKTFTKSLPPLFLCYCLDCKFKNTLSFVL